MNACSCENGELFPACGSNWGNGFGDSGAGCPLVSGQRLTPQVDSNDQRKVCCSSMADSHANR